MSSPDQPSRPGVPAASRGAFVEREFPSGGDRASATAGDRGIASTEMVPAVPADVAAVLAFWRQAGPEMWFAKDADFDLRFREAFFQAHEAAARGDLDFWAATSDGALALLLLLDQFPRNAFRGTPRMYASDAAARRIAAAAVAAGHGR